MNFLVGTSSTPNWLELYIPVQTRSRSSTISPSGPRPVPPAGYWVNLAVFGSNDVTWFWLGWLNQINPVLSAKIWSGKLPTGTAYSVIAAASMTGFATDV